MKTFGSTILFGMGVSFACSFLPSEIRFDTVSPGVVRTVRIMQWTDPMLNTVERIDTLGVAHITDFRSRMASAFQDSSLVFFGRIDTLVYDTSFKPTPLVLLAKADSFPSWPFLARISVDTLFKGTLPAQRFWVRGFLPSHSCTYSWRTGRTFLNVSNGLKIVSDIKMPTVDPGPSESWIPTAHWFDGRYLVSPDFPGLRLDITELHPQYPATGILAPRTRLSPLRPDGKQWTPDGRVVPVTEPLRRKTPAPLLK